MTASYLLGSIESASFASTASFVLTSSFALTSSLALIAQTSSYVLNAVSASFSQNANNANTSLASAASNTSVLAISSLSSSQAVSASYALTASYLLGSIESASFAETASLALTSISSSFAETATIAALALSVISSSIEGLNNLSNTELLTLTGTTSSTILHTQLIPANTFDTNDILTYGSTVFFDNTGGGSSPEEDSYVSLYLNTTSSLDGNEINIADVSVTTGMSGNSISIYKQLYVRAKSGSTSYLRANPSFEAFIVYGSTESNTILVNNSIDWGQDQYLILEVTLGSGSFEATHLGTFIKNT